MDDSSKFRVGNITHSYGVAIGPNARAEVNIFEGPAFPRPNYRSAVADVLTYYTRLFVGREQESKQLLDLARNSASNYLLVTAGAGFGKSALVAWLIHRWETGQWVTADTDLLYFFARQQGERHTPISFLQGVNGQLLDLLGVPGGVPPDLPSLRSQFSDLWGAAVARAQEGKRPLLLLVDGLDEMALEKPSIADLLPTDLPSGSTVIVTSRPMPDHRERVDTTHPFRASKVHHLGGLSERDVSSLLIELGASEEVIAHAPRVWALSRGEPLLARFMSQEVAEQGERALQRLEVAAPDGVESYFKLQLEQLDSAADESDLAWEVLGLLTVSLGGLTLDELAKVLGAAPRKVRKAMAPLRRFFIGESRVELMHQQFIAVLKQEFAAQEQEYEEKLLAFCAAWREHKSPYALRHYAGHLERAKAPDEDFFGLVSEDWMRAREALEGTYAGFLADVQRAWERAADPKSWQTRTTGRGGRLAMQIRCALCGSSVAALSAKITPELLALALQTAHYSAVQALVVGSQVTNENRRRRALIAITPMLGTEMRATALVVRQVCIDGYRECNLIRAS